MRSGSRVRKDREIYASLQKFAAAGVTATYHSCDVSDWDALARVLDEVRRTAGPISGILHGAGYDKPLRFETKDAQSYHRTISAKVDGAVALDGTDAERPSAILHRLRFHQRATRGQRPHGLLGRQRYAGPAHRLVSPSFGPIVPLAAWTGRPGTRSAWSPSTTRCRSSRTLSRCSTFRRPKAWLTWTMSSSRLAGVRSCHRRRIVRAHVLSGAVRQQWNDNEHRGWVSLRDAGFAATHAGSNRARPKRQLDGASRFRSDKAIHSWFIIDFAKNHSCLDWSRWRC